MTDRKKSFATRAVQVGEADPRTGAHITPLYQTSTFAYGSFERGERLFAGYEDGYVYSRIGNPTTRAFELAVADLEGAEDAVAFASGMAAVSSLAITLLEPGAQVLLLGPLYGGTEGLYLDILTRFGIEVRVIGEEELPSALSEGPALLYLETPRSSGSSSCRACRPHRAIAIRTGLPLPGRRKPLRSSYGSGSRWRYRTGRNSSTLQASGVKRLCVEAHGHQLVYNTETLLRLRGAAGPSVGVNFDPSHIFWMGGDPVAALHALGECIFHVHAKDTRIEEAKRRKDTLLETKPNGWHLRVRLV